MVCSDNENFERLICIREYFNTCDMHKFANDTITYAITCTFVGAEGDAVVAPYPISFAAIMYVLKFLNLMSLKRFV